MQSAVSASAIPIAEPEGRGNAWSVESVENQTQVFHASHRPLKIPQNRRDFHISTAWACTAWKSGKPNNGFPLSHPAHAMTMTVLSLNPKPKKGSRPHAPPHSPTRLFLRSTKTDFMLNFQLENAAGQRDEIPTTPPTQSGHNRAETSNTTGQLRDPPVRSNP
jgi:hypothetical protein